MVGLVLCVRGSFRPGLESSLLSQKGAYFRFLGVTTKNPAQPMTAIANPAFARSLEADPVSSAMIARSKPTKATAKEMFRAGMVPLIP